MNITGYGQYSKAITSTKNPTKTMDQQLKLVFVYPILTADKIKVQSTPPFEQLIRDFISVTFLTDLFIENAFNVIGIANQVRPLWDEKQQPVDITGAMIGAASAYERSTGTGIAPPSYNVGEHHKYLLQQKITQKTAVIQQLIKTDPRLAKLRPYIETITMGNMLEVPVIVGTAHYPVDTLTLMWVLIAAISLNRSLTNESDVDFIFNELEKLTPEKYWTLLQNLIQTPEQAQQLGTFFQRGMMKVYKGTENWLAGRQKMQLPRVRRMIHNQAIKLQQDIEKPPDFEMQRQFAPLFLKKEDLAQTKLFFKFVLQSDFAAKRFGINTANEMSKKVDVMSMKLSAQLSRLRDWTMSSFQDIMSTTGTFWLLSVGNLISAEPSDLNISDQKETYIDHSLYSDIEDDLGELFIAIDDSLKENSVENTKEKIASLKDLCNIDSSEVIRAINDWSGSSSIQSGGIFSSENYMKFLDLFDKSNGMCRPLISKMEKQFNYILSSNQQQKFTSHRQRILQKINLSVKNFIAPFLKEMKDTNTSVLSSVMGYSDVNRVIRSNVPPLHEGLVQLIYFMFLTQLQTALCKFILVADVDLETSTTEVTAWPNYTLVLPVEIIMALHAAIMGKSWKHILSGGQTGRSLNSNSTPMTPDRMNRMAMPDVSDNYIKGIVKYMSKRINVPNLIIIDSKKGEMYYKLMNQSDVNKTKLSTISTFIESKLNRPLTTQNY